ncbi:MAG: dUTP diphosphatase [Alphaproteobacteria bacterium]|nr:dUTP diphosphatase [Alphaproteobacteria bacterium]
MTEPIVVAIERLPNGEGLPLPRYATPGSAGLDLVAAVESELLLHPGSRALVPTGFRLALPEGYEGQVRPRSGLALRAGITVLNAPGTIDADYRGEVGVVLVNLGKDLVRIRRGDRIAQLIVAPVSRVTLDSVDTLPDTSRGAGGFGSTGVRSGTGTDG